MPFKELAMLNSFDNLTGAGLTATDGAIGHVKAVLFEDIYWTIRYLVVDTENWLTGRELLISPCSVKQALGHGHNLDLWLTRFQIQASPDIYMHQSVTRQHERDHLAYCDYPPYQRASDLWVAGGYPVLSRHDPETAAMMEQDDRLRANNAVDEQAVTNRDYDADDVNLHSSIEVSSYAIHASDGSCGHVKDFIFDDGSWTIRYLVVDTAHWWPGGRKVLVATCYIVRIDRANAEVRLSLTRAAVKGSRAAATT
jgi:hypothetical protein